MTAGTRVCRACGRPVIVALTVRGKWMLVDEEADDAGNQATRRDHTGRWLTRQLGADEQPEPYERRRMPHVATCPQSAPPRPIRRDDGALSLAAARDRRRRGLPLGRT